MKVLEDKVKEVDLKADKIHDMTLQAKREMHETFSKAKLEHMGILQKINITESKMDANISDCKFWVKTYTDAFKSHEATMV